MNAIEKARAVVSALEAELAETAHKATATAVVRRRLSYDAHGCGDEAARTELSAANAASATLAIEAENLRSAIEAAKARVVEAEREVGAKKTREVAREAKAIIVEAETFGAAMAAGLDTLCEALTGLGDSFNKLERLEYPVAQPRLRLLAYTRSVQDRLRQAGLDFEIVRPYLRHSLEHLNAGYLEPSRGKAAHDLGEAVVADAEAA